MAGDSALGCGARWDGDDLLLAVRVVPRASADVVLPEADCLKVRITAPPVDGQANAHLCKVLAGHFGVPRSRVELDHGATSRIKQVRVLAPARIPEFLGL